MPAAATLKSPNVCANCKARKKRCDKSLPRCRYCADHDLPCLYQTLNHRPRNRAIADSALASAASPRPQSDVWKTAGALQASNLVSASTQLLFDSFACSVQITHEVSISTVESTLCVQAQRLLETTGLYLDEISVRYFQGVHTFVPII